MSNKPTYEELEQRINELEAEVLYNKRKSDGILNAIFEYTSDALYAKDLEGRYLHMNSIGAQIIGRPVEEIIGRDDNALFLPDDAERMTQNDRGIISTGESIAVEETITKNGATRTYLSAKSPYRDKDGNVIGIIGVSRDITDRKRIAEELELRSEIIGNMAEGICLVRVSDGTFVYANPKFEEMFGYERGELIGKNVSVVNAPTDKSPLETANEIIKSLNEKGVWEGDILNIRKGGTGFWCHANISTFEHPEHGKVWIAIHSDMTQWKKAEAALKESEERYRTVFEESPIGIGIASFDGNLYATNRAAKDMFGFPDDFKNINMSQFYYDPSERAKLVNEIKVSGKVSDREIKFKRTNGTYFWGLINFDVIFLDGQKRLIASVRDITEHKLMEEELIKAQRMESIGILAGGIAHDFNNLLTVIGNRISMAKLSNNPDELFNALTSAENACRRAADITKRLLTFSKGGAPVTKIISITGLIKESVDFASRGSNVKINTSLPDDVWSVDVDEGQISQVINNLIINAQQAMPDGGEVDIAIENIVVNEDNLYGLLAQGKYLRITVKDSGIGIPAKHIDKIFDPYFTTKPKGSGLGLATSYSIIKNHKGYILAKSEEGVGTTFHIYLPAAEHDIQENIKAYKNRVVGKGSILLMDDDEMLRDSSADLLSSLGYEVKTANDGAEAIDLYVTSREAGRPFDIVILDLTVPGGMGGKETIRKLIEIDPNVNAVVSSGYCDDPLMADFSKHGFKGVLTKPYEIEKLRNIIEGV